MAARSKKRLSRNSRRTTVRGSKASEQMSGLWSRLWENWQGKALSLAGALVIYSFYQTAIQDEVSFVLPLQTSAAQDRIVSLRDTRKGTLRLSGRAQDLKNLRSSDFELYVHLSPASEGLQKLPVQYRLRNNNLQLKKDIAISVEPESVSLLVEKLAVRRLPIEASIQGYPATGYSLGTYRIFPESVRVSGPASALEQLEAISTQAIDITGKNQSFQELVDLELPMLPGVSGADQTGSKLQLDFQRTQVEIQIDARSETQTFSIKPEIENLPENLRLISILPGIVQLTLQGSSAALQQIEEDEQFIQIKLDGGDIFASGRYALPVVIDQLPPSITLLGSTPSRVTVIVSDR